MGSLILPGQALAAGQAPGQLNQYYGVADTIPTIVTAAGFTNLSTLYTIPAGEAYAGASYELSCAGYGTQGSTQQQLAFTMFAAAGFGSQPFVAAALLNASQAFRWWMKLTLTCADGVNSWWGSLEGAVCESGQSEDPGVTGQQGVPVADCNTGAHLAAVSSSIACSIQAKWASTTGAPTLTCVRTTFRKVA